MIRPVHKLAILSIILILTGIGTAAYGYRAIGKWQQVVAQVQNSTVVSYKTKRGTRYRGELDLQYQFKDQGYNVPVSVPVSSSTYEGARDSILRYNSGSTTTLFVNPQEPTDFLLEGKGGLRFFGGSIAMTAVGALLGLICLVQVVVMRRWFCPDCATSVPRHHVFCFHCGRKLPRAKKWVRA